MASDDPWKPPTGDALTGTLLAGTYRVGRLLGEGAMGAVYEGTLERLGRPVALKVLRTRGDLSDEQLERFSREARAAAALGHPNIAQTTDFVSAPGEPPFLVMERLVGQTLREAIAHDRRLPEARVAYIGRQMLDALTAAHEAGIVHRDIKPDNVFLTRMTGVSDVVKILDFGIAKLSGDRPLTAIGALMGSPAYMSPEQVVGGLADARTDLFGVGATLYHALAGRLPFDAKNIVELFGWIVDRPATPLAELVPGIDPRLVQIIDRAMQKAPSRRYQSAAEMQRALEALEARPTEATLPLPRTSAPPRLEVLHPYTGTVAEALAPLGRLAPVGIPPAIGVHLQGAPPGPSGLPAGPPPGAGGQGAEARMHAPPPAPVYPPPVAEGFLPNPHPMLPEYGPRPLLAPPLPPPPRPPAPEDATNVVVVVVLVVLFLFAVVVFIVLGARTPSHDPDGLAPRPPPAVA